MSDKKLNLHGLLSRTRLGPLGVVVLTIVSVAGLFQNCGSYQPMSNPLYDATLASSCLGASCAKDLNYLTINVSNSDPILITRTTETAIDLGGYCDQAGYPDSRIYVEMKSGATTVIPAYLSSSKCDSNGRFRVLVTLPGTYDYNLAYSIVVTMRAVESDGREYDHPTGINRREVAVLTAP